MKGGARAVASKLLAKPKIIRTQYKKLQCMNGTECRPQASVAEGGPESYEGHIGDTPKTLSIFLATPTPSDNRRGALRLSVSPTEVRRGGTDGTGSLGAGGARTASGGLKSDIQWTERAFSAISTFAAKT